MNRRKMATSTIQQGDVIHHQNTVTLHHLGSLAGLKSDGSLFAYTVSTDSSTQDLILYHSQNNGTMDFLLEGENGGSSSESIANILDEGLGTSLDGTDEISSSIHSTLGRNDSGVFSSDEMTTSSPNGTTGSTTTVVLNNNNNNSIEKNKGAAAGGVVVPATVVVKTTTAAAAVPVASNTTMTTSNNAGTTTALSVVTSSSSTSKTARPKNSSPNRQGPQRCVVCGKVFSNASALTKHKLTHSDERKHACVMCGKAFKRQDHLNGHMLTHRNKKPFECKAKGCGKSYCDGRSLRRHIESRHGPEALATLPIQASSSTSASITPISNEQQQPSNNNNNNNNSNNNNSSSSIIIPKTEVVSSLVIRPDSNEKMIVLKKAPTAKASELTTVEAGVDGKANIILGLDSNPLDKNNFIQARDIQVALQPVIVKEEQQQQQQPIKIEPIEISDSRQILGLTLSTPNGTLCGIVGGDGKSLRNSIALSPASAATTTTSTAPTSSASSTTLPTAVPVTIRTTHSQLHQLLTQRASNTAGSPSILNLRAGTIKTEPGLGISTPSSTSSSSFDSSWATTPDAEKSLTGLGSGAAAAAVATILSNVVGKCPTSPTASSSSCSMATGAGTMGIMTNSGGEGSTGQDGAPNPNLLKQQLELIHQIIQQAQEESNLAAAAAVAAAATPPVPTPPSLPPPTTLTTPKVLTGKMTKAGASRKVKGVQQIGESAEDEILGKGGSNSNEEKPVECTICCRRFKNTPALNGHMRLHGGYFKKDAEGKKKDAVSSGKEPSNATPLQTASVSVRALIEEKIIQKRNTIQGFGQQQSQPSETSATTTTTTTGTENNVNMEQDQTLNVNISSSFPQSSSGNGRLNVVVVSTAPVAASTSSSCSSVGGPDGAEQSFQFVYGDDTSDYLLTEEEVFNEVSSICPDSFLNVIDESILNGAAGEQLPPEWNWAATSAGVDSANSRLTSLFVGADSSPSDQQLGATVSTSSFTPLASLDGNNFYTSPTPQSPSVNSQDSPSFSYPTPPASLESHNALQSPLFPFPSITNGASPATAVSHSAPSSSFSTYESTASSTAAATTGVINKSSTAAANPIITNALTSNSINNNQQQQLSFASLVAASDLNQIIAATLTGSSSTAAGTVVTRKVSDGDVKNNGGTELNVLTPSSSPSLMTSSSSSNADDSQQNSMKEMKVNEPLRMNCATTETSTAPTTTDIFLSPNSRPSSSSNSNGLQKMGVKRKQVRNTFASNLRPQTNLPYKTHFTPYPILSPVRSAPGLFWTFSPKLSHVDDAKRESPKVNIGSNFQAEIPEFSSKKPKLEMMDDGEKENNEENELWKPQVAKNCALEELDNYLAFACCSAIPGGGRNKEYALHVLNYCNGDIVDAMVFLMNPNPSLPNKLRMYKYQEKDKWTMEELALFQEALLRFGKDFNLVAKQVRTKGREECVSFYHVWKKVFAQEYEEARAVWKLSDGKFTEELLKTVPPPPVSSSPSPLNTSGRANNNNNSLDGAGSIMMMEQCSNNSKVPNTRLDACSPSCDSNGSSNLVGGGANQSLPLEEYPCKVCGKIFNKVRSRSAHMKSHRPPDSTDSSNGNKKGKANSSKLAPPLTTTTTTLLTSSLSSSPPPASPIKTMAASPIKTMAASPIKTMAALPPPPLPLQQIIKIEPGTVPATPSASSSESSHQLPVVPSNTSVVTGGGATDALISEGNSGGRET